MAVVLGTNSGFVTAAPTADPAGTGTTIDGNAVVTKHTSPADAEKITQIGWYRASGTNAANWEIALYSDLAGVPLTRLFVDATNSTTSNGWVTVAVDWDITPNTPYWLALQMDAHSGSSQVDAAASGGAGSDLFAASTLADPYAGGAVADADGMYAIYALVQVSVTGAGSPDAQAAVVDGTGVSSSTGTGTLAAQAAVVDGAGEVGDAVIEGSGVLAAQAAAADGAGASASVGSGAPAAQAATAEGDGTSLSSGAGVPAAQAASTDGAGVSASIGAGMLASQAAAVAGEGYVGDAGTGRRSNYKRRMAMLHDEEG